jgi:hypothetical protein
MPLARSSRAVLAFAFAACAVACGTKKTAPTGVDAASDLGGRPQISAFPASLNLGMVCPGYSTAPATFQVFNMGDAIASVGLRIIADDPTEFTATGTGCAMLVPGQTCTVAVVFSPKTTGPKTGAVEVTSLSNGQKLNIALTGSSSGGPGPASLSPSALDFGSVIVGTLSPAKRVTLTKQGSIGEGCSPDAREPRFTVTLPSGDFVITSDTCSTGDVPVGGTCTVDIALRPTTLGAKSATLVVGYSGVQKHVALIGTGVSTAVDASVDTDIPSEDAANVTPDLALDASLVAQCTVLGGQCVASRLVGMLAPQAFNVTCPQGAMLADGQPSVIQGGDDMSSSSLAFGCNATGVTGVERNPALCCFPMGVDAGGYDASALDATVDQN